MNDDGWFAENKGRNYQVRCANPGKCPGADPEQAILIARLGP